VNSPARAVPTRLAHALLIALVAALIGGLYLAVDALMQHLGRLSPRTAAAVAAGPAALAFLPVCLWAERWVDRLVHGARPTPYSVLAGISAPSPSGPADAPDLSRVVEAAGRGLGARVCRLTVTRPGLSERTYVWSEPAGPAGPAEPGDLVEVAIRLAGERIGSLTVDAAAVVGLHRRHLLDDVVGSLGVVLQASRLGIELERQLRAVHAHAAEIAASRRGLVAQIDAERRRIERDLHDGAQHHLVFLRLSLGLVEHQVSLAQLERARWSLEQISETIDVAESTLAQTVAGVSSPVLAQRGLVQALREELDGEPSIVLDADGVEHARRFPADVEAAVWFCCLEAVSNARKHAPGATVRVTLRTGEGRLAFEVRDDGPGWGTGEIDGTPGRGLRNMISRAWAAGGRVTIRSTPGAGTAMVGSIPVTLEAPAGPLPLVGEVRILLDVARTLYGQGPGAARVRELARGLDQQLRTAGPPQLGAPAVTRFAGRHATLKAWAVLTELSELVAAQPPPAGADSLLHGLDRIRSGGHELREIEAIDAVRSQEYDLAAADLEAAARLLGESGQDAHQRLGLAPGTEQGDVETAANQALTRWRARASHPASPPPVRALATVVVQSCERILQAARAPV
jgi:signal transduction histidine kinase